MQPLPGVRVAATHTRKVRPGTLGAPHEGMVVREFAGDRVMAVALGLRPEGAYLLGVADVAAFPDVDVASLELLG